MTGITFTAEINDAELVQRLGALFDRMTNMSGFFANVSEELLNQTKDRFSDQVGPDGIPWQELSAGTIIRRALQGATPIQILRSNRPGSGMFETLFPSHGADFAAVSSNKPYAAIHQFGGTINRPARQGKVFRHKQASVKAYSITMPARPFLGLSAEDEQDITKIASDWLEIGE